jgi:8-amino-7-oxononanoate synthase
VLLDRLSHASLIDGGLLSAARFKRFAHADARAAETALAEHSETTSVVATDGVFSMDGDIGPLDKLARASKSHDAWLVVDDAHGLGVIGATGRGAVEYFGSDTDAVPVLVGTLGKAFGSFGAFVAGSTELIELLMQKARPYIYTTALPQPVAAASRKALEIAQRETWRRERVLALATRFRSGAAQAGVPLLAAPALSAGRSEAAGPQAIDQPVTPIQPVLLGSSEAALRAQRELLEAGFCVVAIRPPTVPQGSARLRVTLSAAHTEAQVDELVETLGRICAAQRMVS